MYHYTESGLDNIYLINGFRIVETPYGEGVSIQNTEGLHKAIGQWIVKEPKPIVGAELRFLRLEMETTQRDLAAILATTEQSLRLWEKHRGKPLPGSSDRLLRALYLDYLGKDGSVKRMLERLAELDQQTRTDVVFRQSNHHWKSAGLPEMQAACG